MGLANSAADNGASWGTERIAALSVGALILFIIAVVVVLLILRSRSGVGTAAEPAKVHKAGAGRGGPQLTHVILPEGWSEVSPEDSGAHSTYYYHAATGATQWVLPVSSDAKSALPPGWTSSSSADASGSVVTYYYHEATGAVQWERPEEDHAGTFPRTENASSTEGGGVEPQEPLPPSGYAELPTPYPTEPTLGSDAGHALWAANNMPLNASAPATPGAVCLSTHCAPPAVPTLAQAAPLPQLPYGAMSSTPRTPPRGNRVAPSY